MRAKTVGFQRSMEPKDAMNTGLGSRDKVIELLYNTPKELRTEIDYHLLEVEHTDSDYNVIDAFDDAATLVDFPNHMLGKEEIKIKHQCQDVYIQIGYAVPMKDYRNNHSGFWFKRNNIYYETNGSWAEFINKLE